MTDNNNNMVTSMTIAHKCAYESCNAQNPKLPSQLFRSRPICDEHYKRECEKFPVTCEKYGKLASFGFDPCGYNGCTNKLQTNPLRSRILLGKYICAKHYNLEAKYVGAPNQVSTQLTYVQRNQYYSDIVNDIELGQSICEAMNMNKLNIKACVYERCKDICRNGYRSKLIITDDNYICNYHYSQEFKYVGNLSETPRESLTAAQRNDYCSKIIATIRKTPEQTQDIKCAYQDCSNAHANYNSRVLNQKICKLHYHGECVEYGLVAQHNCQLTLIDNIDKTVCAYKSCEDEAKEYSRFDKSKKICANHYSNEKSDIIDNSIKNYVVENFNGTGIIKSDFNLKELSEPNLTDSVSSNDIIQNTKCAYEKCMSKQQYRKSRIFMRQFICRVHYLEECQKFGRRQDKYGKLTATKIDGCGYSECTNKLKSKPYRSRILLGKYICERHQRIESRLIGKADKASAPLTYMQRNEYYSDIVNSDNNKKERHTGAEDNVNLVT